MKLITLIDDIDKSVEDVKTVIYVVDGVVYEVELSAKNAEEFRRALQPFMDVSRKTTKSALMKSLPSTRKTPALPAERVRREEVKETIPQETPKTHEGLESESIPEPTGTQVTPLESEPLDSNNPENDVPTVWRPAIPIRGESPEEAALKAQMWGDLIGRPVKKVTDEIMGDWRAFYIKRLWNLVPQ